MSGSSDSDGCGCVVGGLALLMFCFMALNEMAYLRRRIAALEKAQGIEAPASEWPLWDDAKAMFSEKP